MIFVSGYTKLKKNEEVKTCGNDECKSKFIIKKKYVKIKYCPKCRKSGKFASKRSNLNREKLLSDINFNLYILKGIKTTNSFKFLFTQEIKAERFSKKYILENKYRLHNDLINVCNLIEKDAKQFLRNIEKIEKNESNRNFKK